MKPEDKKKIWMEQTNKDGSSKSREEQRGKSVIWPDKIGLVSNLILKLW